MTKHDVRILSLSVLLYELFERPSYVAVIRQVRQAWPTFTSGGLMCSAFGDVGKKVSSIEVGPTALT